MQSPIIVPYFILFLVMWAYMRHFINLSILSSLLPLPSPFPEHITEQINTALSHASNSTSGLIGTVSPFLAPLEPITRVPATLFPENTALINAATSKITNYFQGEAAFATVGPYTLDWVTQQYKCWISQWITFGLLLSLQLVNIFWFYLILRILYRLFASNHLDDVRSEDDDDDEELEVKKEDLDSMRKEQGEISEKTEVTV
jgi:very-long-chain ceramide synthase